MMLSSVWSGPTATSAVSNSRAVKGRHVHGARAVANFNALVCWSMHEREKCKKTNDNSTQKTTSSYTKSSATSMRTPILVKTPLSEWNSSTRKRSTNQVEDVLQRLMLPLAAVPAGTPAYFENSLVGQPPLKPEARLTTIMPGAIANSSHATSQHLILNGNIFSVPRIYYLVARSLYEIWIRSTHQFASLFVA